MIKIISLIEKTIHKLFPLIGFLLLSLYIWGRFFRNRLPREIPFDLTLIRLIILISICTGYIYIIYRLIKPKTPHQIILNFLVYIVNIVKTFDNYLKQFNIVSRIYKKIFTYLANKIDYNNFYLWRNVYRIINTIPHIILLCAFTIDTFYFHKLFYFYKVIWVTLFFFIIPFSLYSFNYVCEIYILYWEKNCKSVWTRYKQGVLPPKDDYWHPDFEEPEEECLPPNDMEISFREFLPVYFQEIYYEQKTPHFYYIIRPTMEWYENFFKEHNLTWETCGDAHCKIIDKDLNLIIRFKAIQETYDLMTTMTSIPNIIKYTRIFVYIGYLICWFYILYMSLHTFKDFYLFYGVYNILNVFLLQSKFPFGICILILILTVFNRNKQ